MKSRNSIIAFLVVVVVFSLFAGAIYYFLTQLGKSDKGIEDKPEKIEAATKRPGEELPNDKEEVDKKAQSDVDFGPYMADLQRRIKRAWFPPKGSESKRVMVVFKVHRNGTMSDLRLTKGSGDKAADQAAKKAVENAAPFRPLPKGAPPDVDIQFTFDYNVFKKGKKELKKQETKKQETKKQDPRDRAGAGRGVSR